MKIVLRIFLLCALWLFSGSNVSAGDFFYGFNSDGGNFWLQLPMYPAQTLNNLIGGVGICGTSYAWHYVKDSQGKIKVNGGNYFGFKARDLFRDFGIGFTFGYQPRFSVLGLYINGGYNFRQFNTQVDRSLETMEKYRIPSWNASVGLRLTPMISNLENHGWSPIIEVGTKYSQPFSIKAPYGNDEAQLGKGLTTKFALGFRKLYDDRVLSIAYGYEMPHFNYFNKDFVAPDGSKPYEDVTAKDHRIYCQIMMEF